MAQHALSKNVSLVVNAAGMVLASVGILFVLASPAESPRQLVGLVLHLTGLLMLLAFRRHQREADRRTLPSPDPNLAIPRDRYVEPELWDAPPRVVRFRPAARIVRFFARTLLLLGLVAWSGSTLGNAWQWHRLATRGVTIPAQVIGRAIVAPGETTGTVYYAYRAHNRTVESQAPVRRVDYPQWWTGKAVLVTYLPSAPDVHVLGTLNSNRGARFAQLAFWLLLGANLSLWIVLPVVRLERNLRRQRDLAENGMATTGVVTASEPVSRFGQISAVALVYQFRDATGQPIIGREAVDALAGSRLLPGATVTVLYPPDRPDQSRLYRILNAVRVVARNLRDS